MCCLSIAVIMAFNGSVVSEDFCEAFRAEGNRISYLYKQGLVDNDFDNQTIHVIINGQSWDLVYDPVERNLTSFNSSVSQSAPLFTNQYMGAACISIGGETGKCDTILFAKGDTITKVNVTRIANNDHRELKPLNEFSQPEEKTVNGLPQRNYSFVFTNSRENRIDLVVGPTADKSLTRLYFRFAPNGDNGFDVLEHFTNIKDVADIRRTRDFDMDKEVIGIWYQFHPRKAEENVYYYYGHIFLLKDNQLVFWCWKMVDMPEVCMSHKTMTNTHLLITVLVQTTGASGGLYRDNCA